MHVWHSTQHYWWQCKPLTIHSQIYLHPEYEGVNAPVHMSSNWREKKDKQAIHITEVVISTALFDLIDGMLSFN